MGKGEPDLGLEGEKISETNRMVERTDPERATWTNPCDFFISCLGYAVGLGRDCKHKHVTKLKYFCCRKHLAVSILVFQARWWLFPNSVFSYVIFSGAASVFIGGWLVKLLSSSY